MKVTIVNGYFTNTGKKFSDIILHIPTKGINLEMKMVYNESGYCDDKDYKGWARIRFRTYGHHRLKNIPWSVCNDIFEDYVMVKRKIIMYVSWKTIGYFYSHTVQIESTIEFTYRFPLIISSEVMEKIKWRESLLNFILKNMDVSETSKFL